MHLGEWKIDDYLTFVCNTHNPATGAGVDADADPTYRIYEDESAPPILTGTMSLLDAANTVGFYSERVQLLAATGFERGKIYTIYITATVTGIAGTISHTFQINHAIPAGAIEYTYTVTDLGSGLPIEGVEVWFSTDIAGNNIVWKGETDAFGVARATDNEKPWLDAGTYYIWCQRAGYTFTNPDTEVVS